ncbi:MAG TPA: DUF2071 domain-containing protein [Planktothrix sp.]|jgi:hypothetical protein
MRLEELLKHTEHRPYPLPQGSWAMKMTWEQLLFMHWPVAPDDIRRLVPAPFEIDTYDGTAWVGVIPFGMSNVSPRNVPALPYMSKFLELNVRTYVKFRDWRAVYFFSLDAANPIAVEAARAFYHLPYLNAQMSWMGTEFGVTYSSKRTDRRGAPIGFQAEYRPVGAPYSSDSGSLAEFLTERYCLVTTDSTGRPCVGHIHHIRWPLQDAEVDIVENTMCDPLQIKLLRKRPVLHYAARLETVAWSLQ